jgi:hypothetical protein
MGNTVPATYDLIVLLHKKVLHVSGSMPQKNNPALLMFVFFDFGTSPENDEVLLYWRNCKKEQQQHQKAHLRNVK